jgi:biotin synthase
VLGALEKHITAGKNISRSDARFLASVSGNELFTLFSTASRIRNHFKKNVADICSIVNAKSGSCPEDCSYCAQSSKNTAEISTFSLLCKDSILEKAREALDGGARRFCIVTSGRKASRKELNTIAETISDIRSMGLLPCATLGLLSHAELLLLKDAGLVRYHHNLETSERFFPAVCSTHTYQDKITTIRDVHAAGLSLCSGGIFGIGENWEDRIDLAFSLKEINPDSVPINFLIPIAGTKLEHQPFLEPLEALRIISLFRCILPDKEIRICGGRMQTLGEFNSFIFFAGADSLLAGNYLTTPGRNFEDDRRLIEQFGLTVPQIKSEKKCHNRD